MSAIKRADDETPRDLHQTADLLEALRRRRGEREAATYEERTDGPPPTAADPPVDAPVRVVDEPFDIFEADCGRSHSVVTAPRSRPVVGASAPSP